MASREPPKDLPVEPPAVLAVTLPDEFFPDGDDICKKASTHIATELIRCLEGHGHRIADWLKPGGCQEDWGTYLRSTVGEVRFEYFIGFFPRPDGNDRCMFIQYGIKTGLWRRIFKGREKLSMNHPLHAVLQKFGGEFSASELLTEREFELDLSTPSQRNC